MRKIVRSIGYGMLAALVIVAGAASSNAQASCDDTEAIAALDKKVRDNYAKNPTVKQAIDAGKEFLEKYGKCPGSEEFATWITGQMPKWETRYKDWELGQKMGPLFTRFDNGINEKKYDDVYSAGKEILVVEPKNVHVMIPLGIIALNESYNKNYKYNDDALRYGKMAIDELKSGNAKPKMIKGQVFMNKAGQPAFSTWDFSKEEAIDELTYSIAYINFYTKNDKKSALPLYYQLSQSKGRFKDEPRVYGAIADYYIAEKDKLGAELALLVKKGEELEKKTVPANEIEKHNEEIKQLVAVTDAKLGLFNGYAEPAIDALGHTAIKVAPVTTPGDKTYKEGLEKLLGAIYLQRFDKDTAMTGKSAFVAKMLANPFPDPLSEVKPVIEPVTTTSTTAPAPANGKTSVATKPSNK